MEANKANTIFLQYKDLVPSDKSLMLKTALNNAGDDKYDNLIVVKTYSGTNVILFSVFLGSLGIDRFYIGDIGMGIAKLLLGWVTFGIWPLVDIFFCYKRAKEKNLQNILLSLQ